MNEKGFFNIVGLCLLLIIALSIKTFQELEGNYFYEAASYQENYELQNAADSGLNEAVKKICNHEISISKPPDIFIGRNQRQQKISVTQPTTSENSRIKNPSVTVYVERSIIHTEPGKFFEGNISANDKEGIILISVASCDGKIFEGKIFRRSFAYILDDNIIHYMNSD